jgi:hypothetical protein
MAISETGDLTLTGEIFDVVVRETYGGDVMVMFTLVVPDATGEYEYLDCIGEGRTAEIIAALPEFQEVRLGGMFLSPTTVLVEKLDVVARTREVMDLCLGLGLERVSPEEANDF